MSHRTRESARILQNPLRARLILHTLLVIFFGCLRNQQILCSAVNLSIGYVSSNPDGLALQSELEILNAFQMALDDATNLQQLQPKISLSLTYKNIKGNQSITDCLDEVIQSGAITVFGHSDICDQTASVLKSRNRIAISNVCGDEKLSNKTLFPTFLRTRPSDTQIVESIISLLQNYSLNEMSIIVQNTTKWLAVLDSFEKRLVADMADSIVHHRAFFKDNRLCCALEQSCCHLAWSFDILERTKYFPKVFIFLGEKLLLQIFMQTIQDVEIDRANEYLIIWCESEAYSNSWAVNFFQHPREVQKHLDLMSLNSQGVRIPTRKFSSYSQQIESSWLSDLPHSSYPSYSKDNKPKIMPRVMIIIRNIANEHLSNFNRRLRSYSSRRGTLLAEEVISSSVPIFAAYAYDAVTVIVKALHSYVNEFALNRQSFENTALNGSVLFAIIMRIQNFSSVRGGFISFNSNGDTEDNYFAIGSLDLFLQRDKSSSEIPMTNLLIPFGFFRGSVMKTTTAFMSALEDRLVYSIQVFYPTHKPNQTTFAEFTKTESIEKGDEITENISTTKVVVNLLALLGMFYVFLHQSKKVAASTGRVNIRIAKETDEEISAHLWNIKQMEVMNGDFRSTNEDYWRMKVWNKSLPLINTWPTVNSEVIKEIRYMQSLLHENVTPLVHAIIEPNRLCLISEFQNRGSLLDILAKRDDHLDYRMVTSLSFDLINGMIYLHDTQLKFHGNLKSSNCLVDSNWTLKITNFGLHHIRNPTQSFEMSEQDYYFNLLWKAPEVLRNPSVIGNPEGDVYSFAIILHELVCRQGPFAIYSDLGDPIRVVNQVKQVARGNRIPVRPPIENLDSRLSFMFPCMMDSWTEEPSERPSFSSVRHHFMKFGEILDPVKRISMSETPNNLDEKGALQTQIAQVDDILHSIIPKSVADCLANGLPVETQLWENVTVFEADLVGFTKIATETTPLGTMILLDDVYTLFDSIARGYDVCKVGTIGDAYIVVSGIHSTRGENSAGEIASMALEMVEKMKESGIEHRGKPLVVRIGVHTGQVATGVVGTSDISPTYSVFGETVSTASRLESTSSELRIQISEASYQALQKIGGYITEERHDGADAMESFKTYWLIGHTEKAVQRREKDSSGGSRPLCNRQSIISLTQTDIFIDQETNDDREI